MLISRALFLPGSVLILTLGAAHAVLAQSAPAAAPKPASVPGAGPKAAVSPVSPGDLSKPAFDTTTRDYGSLPGPDQAAATVVAEVEGTAITLGDIKDAIASLPPAMSKYSFDELYPGVLDKLIKEKALVVRARQQGVDEAQEYRRKARSLADTELANFFMKQALTRQITEVMLLERYNRDFAGKPGPVEVHARVIQVEAEDKAKDLIARLHAGEDFTALARRVQQGSHRYGGRRSWFRDHGPSRSRDRGGHERTRRGPGLPRSPYGPRTRGLF